MKHTRLGWGPLGQNNERLRIVATVLSGSRESFDLLKLR